MIILIQCRDQVGLVAEVSGILKNAGLNINAMDEYVDVVQKRFYMRLDVDQPENTIVLEASLTAILPHDALLTLNPSPEKKIVVLVTKEHHCLADILVRNFFGTLGASVQCVIGNHAVLQNICERFDIPFHLISHEQISKQEFERSLVETIRQYPFNYIVLAKFMRILSPDFVANFPKQLINIHHSFLPAFVGANPYQRAYERGVKLIGATAHFVTNDLDEGPIIAQQIIPVNHAHTAADMMRAGKEIEKSVLAKGLQLVFEDRVFVYNNKTIVFE